MKKFVILFNPSVPISEAYHICTKEQYEIAKEQPTYSWQQIESFNTEKECEDHINGLREETKPAKKDTKKK